MSLFEGVRESQRLKARYEREGYVMDRERHRSSHASRQRQYRGDYYGQAWPRQPFEVHCDGWVSDTLTLERHGYRFFVERDMRRMATRVIMGKENAKAMVLFDDIHMEDHTRNSRPIEFHGEFVEQLRGRTIDTYQQVSMNDAYWCEQEVMRDQRHIDPRDLFPQSKAVGDSMIVLPDTQTVTEVLDLLLEKQAPRQEEIRSNQKRRQHASIITLEDVA